MEHSLTIASELGKKFFMLTYDLAVAKIALRNQSAEDKFKILFIAFGIFHIMMSLHKAIGKFISGSGLLNILIDIEILASGSIFTFVTGKHFNRCKKIHPLLAVCLEILHFERFLAQYRDQDWESIINALKSFNKMETIRPKRMKT